MKDCPETNSMPSPKSASHCQKRPQSQQASGLWLIFCEFSGQLRLLPCETVPSTQKTGLHKHWLFLCFPWLISWQSWKTIIGHQRSWLLSLMRSFTKYIPSLLCPWHWEDMRWDRCSACLQRANDLAGSQVNAPPVRDAPHYREHKEWQNHC